MVITGYAQTESMLGSTLYTEGGIGFWGRSLLGCGLLFRRLRAALSV